MDARRLEGAAAVSYRQAYYTSCRTGLLGTPGFQFNAVSVGLDGDALRDLESAHAAYTAPRDQPLEPTREQLAGFPVALKYRPLDRLGPVVSRTTYVGREFRGRNGAPDSGRFGNYFSHIVVPDPGKAELDGLLPVELWGAPHWTTAEAPDKRLPALERLTPGRLDLESVLSMLDGARRAWLAPLLDAVLRALDGGPRVVVVEPDPARAAAWVAWASYALPHRLAQRLTFSTYEGRPRYADDVQLCVTTPACDSAFSPQEIGRTVTLLAPPWEPSPDDGLSLYARVAAAAADRGADALADPLRALSGSDDTTRLGAELALESGLGRLIREAEVAPALDVLEQAARAGRWRQVDAAARELPHASASMDAVSRWGALHALARGASGSEAQPVVDLSISRLLEHLSGLAPTVADVVPPTPLAPSLETLAAWLERLETAGDPARVGALVQAGVDLGLLGLNAALDRRAGAVIASALDADRLGPVLGMLDAHRPYRTVAAAAVAGLAVRTFGDQAALEALAALEPQELVMQLLDECAKDDDRLELAAAHARLRVLREPGARAQALAAIVPRARRDARAAAVARELFGPTGPSGPREHEDLLDAYLAAGARPAADDIERAVGCLNAVSRGEAAGASALCAKLLRLDGRLGGHPAIATFRLLAEPPGAARGIAEWTSELGRVRDASPERVDELAKVAGDAAVACVDDRDYSRALAALARTFGEPWPDDVAAALRRAVDASARRERLIARLFRRWLRMGGAGDDLIHTSLVGATETWSRRRLEAVEQHLDGNVALAWQRWLEDHPPRGFVGRSVSRVLRRGDR